jgi:magnesium transporter
MTPARGAAALEQVQPKPAASLVARMPVEIAADLLRRLASEHRDLVLAALPLDLRRSLAALLAFPAGTAGALMDPRVTILTDDLTAAQALRQLRQSADGILFNIYVLDRQRRLVGVLNLQELLAARPRQLVAALMHEPELRLPAAADRHQIVAHRGWQRVHSLPVVDAKGCFLGAMRYRTLRQLEVELDQARPGGTDTSTAAALGGLFAAGLGGLVDAIAQSVAPPRGAPPSGRSST